MVKADRRKSQDRNSLQMLQKSKTKNFEPKRSAFASGLVNGKLMPNSGSKFGIQRRGSSTMKLYISEDSMRENLEE